MLLQSAAFLTCILALASTLFETGRQRAWALLVFLAFSGMDLMGMALAGGNLGMHLEHWAGIQYSSHVTQAFWVPMHALAGWLGALLFLLWRTDRLPLAAFLAPMPLLALLSPLALIGVVPFAAYAGISTLWSRSLRRADILLPIAATALAIPSLIYLSAGSSAVGAKPNAVSFLQWLVFEAMETVPYLVAAVLAARSSRFGRLVPVLVALLLLALPFGAVSTGPDFTMRVSIASLAILSVLVAEIVTKHPATVGARLGRAVLVSVLVIGSATPLTEVEHVLSRPRQPLSTCSYFGVVPTGAPTYVAPRAAVSAAVAPSHPAIVTPHDPPSCLEVTWLEDERRYRNADFHWPSLF